MLVKRRVFNGDGGVFDVAGNFGQGHHRPLDVAVNVPENYLASPVVNFRGLGDFQVI